MEAYKGYLKNEVEELRAKGHGFLDGTVSRVELRGFSGGFGSYAQSETGKFMIRLRTPSGIVTKEHFKLILNYARQAELEIKEQGLKYVEKTAYDEEVPAGYVISQYPLPNTEVLSGLVC